jgi:UDP-2,3-diacylglucosamine pyrophosphatase LpxH
MEKQNLYFMGDIHGNYEVIKHRIKSLKITNATIIHVGDFGVGFLTHERDVERLEGLNDFLKTKNVTLYVCRGNHDNPIFFNGNYQYDNLKLVEDYTVLNINNQNILLVGGAISIDRVPRQIENTTNIKVGNEVRYWWGTEKFVLDKEKLKDIKDINIVVTHSAPQQCYPVNKNGYPQIVAQFFTIDDTLEQDLHEERQLLSDLFSILKNNGNNPTHHYYGHFHSNHEEFIDNVKHICLGIDKLKFHEDYSDYEEELNKKYGI